MASYSTNQATALQPAPGARTRRRVETALPASDYAHLLEHLENCERDRDRSWTLLAYVLRNKIVHTEPSQGLVERDVVVGGSQVSYTAGGGQVTSGVLLHQARPGSQQAGIIPVSSLLGATLIGMCIGQRAPLLCEDGSVKSLVIVDTVPPT